VPQASILKAGFIRFAPPDKTAIQELSHVGLDRNTEGRQSAGSELVTGESWPHGPCNGRFDFRHQSVKSSFRRVEFQLLCNRCVP
jgi:hypothetical protein